jgi:hypothetical protein
VHTKSVVCEYYDYKDLGVIQMICKECDIVISRQEIDLNSLMKMSEDEIAMAGQTRREFDDELFEKHVQESLQYLNGGEK